jgi:hypothetical protein
LELALQIKQDYADRRNKIHSGSVRYFRAEDIVIHAYLGTYNDVVALIPYHILDGGIGWGIGSWSLEVAGFEFSFPNNSPLYPWIWRNGFLYSIHYWEVSEYCAYIGIFEYYGIPVQPVGTFMPGPFELGWLTEQDFAAMHRCYLLMTPWCQQR